MCIDGLVCVNTTVGAGTEVLKCRVAQDGACETTKLCGTDLICDTDKSCKIAVGSSCAELPEKCVSDSECAPADAARADGDICRVSAEKSCAPLTLEGDTLMCIATTVCDTIT